MKLEFIGDGPALVIEGEERLLIVADLHFGIEADLACTWPAFPEQERRQARTPPRGDRPGRCGRRSCCSGT